MTSLIDRIAAFQAAYTSFETTFLIAFAAAAAIGAIVPLLLRERIELSVGMLFFAACVAVPVGYLTLTGERTDLRAQRAALCARAADRIDAAPNNTDAPARLARAAVEIGCDQPALHLALSDGEGTHRSLMSE